MRMKPSQDGSGILFVAFLQFFGGGGAVSGFHMRIYQMIRESSGPGFVCCGAFHARLWEKS